MDVAIFYWINHWPHFEWLDKILVAIDHFVTSFNPTVTVLVLCGFGLLLRKRKLWLGSLYLLLGFFIEHKLKNLLKSAVGRERPYNVLEDVHVIGIMSTSSKSFPAALAFSTALIGTYMILLTRKMKYFWLSFILAWGIFRIYCGIHYPTDILAGWVLGAVLGMAMYWLYRLTDKGLNKTITAFKQRQS